VTLGAGYVDVEAATDLPLISEVKGCIERHKTSGTTGRDKNKQTRLILSWHDFEGTPSNQSLRRRFRSMAAVGSDLVKIVTYARQPEDNLRILELILMPATGDRRSSPSAWALWAPAGSCPVCSERP
jgi:3-dehydroquinate dehydratase-1